MDECRVPAAGSAAAVGSTGGGMIDGSFPCDHGKYAKRLLWAHSDAHLTARVFFSPGNSEGDGFR